MGHPARQTQPVQAKTNTLQLPTPHSKIQALLFNLWLCPEVIEIWGAFGTKFGKTTSAAAGLSGASWICEGGVYRWIGPIYSQTKIGFRNMKKIFPSDPHLVKPNQSQDMSLYLQNQDTLVDFKSGHRPEDLEGEGSAGTVIDEAAKQKEQVYLSTKTTHTFTRGPMGMFSTPTGKNWFYRGFKEAEEHMKWMMSKGKAPTKIALHGPSMLNPGVTKEAIAENQRTMPDRLFRQYVLAEFLDAGSVFVNHHDCVYTDEVEHKLKVWIHPEAELSDVVIGVDWAKHKDYTVFIALQVSKRDKDSDGDPEPVDQLKVVGYMRFHHIAYPTQVRELAMFARRFLSVGYVLHDKTGVGTAMDDLMERSGLPYEGVAFTNPRKAELVNHLMLTFEQVRLLIPKIPEMISELDVYEVSSSDTGLLVYGAPEGSHDDIVTALFLANKAATEYSPGIDIQFMEDLPKNETPLEDLYSELAEDDDDVDPSVHLFK